MEQDDVTFLYIIDRSRIEIPIIQRDYAQGRADEKTQSIRSGFLGSIADVLSAETAEKPLVLDFIYGSQQKNGGSENGAFLPLDGQQRLTTLFLLHWYLADEEGLERIRDNGETIRSRFSYQTRVSSKNFCNELVQHTSQQISESWIKAKGEQGAPLSKRIKDQSWYVWDWSKDPTIAGMLVMLDEMEDRFRSDKETLWKRLRDQKRIVFHLLELSEFNMSDELYVKMNARGKELSEFDILKSTLEEQMKINKVDEHIQNHWRKSIDSRWMDLFWNNAKRAMQGNGDEKIVENVEKSYLRFLKRMMVFHLFITDGCLKNLEQPEVQREFKRLGIPPEGRDIFPDIRHKAVNEDVLRLVNLFCKAGFFDESFFSFTTSILDGLIFEKDGKPTDVSTLINGIVFDEATGSLFDMFIAKKIHYEKRVLFFAVACFVKYHPAGEVHSDERWFAEFNQWMRVMRNLSTNTIYDTFQDFLGSVTAINSWTKEIYGAGGSQSVLDFLMNAPSLTGFTQEQLKEEIQKAELLQSPEWVGSIRDAEEHPYFVGQIRFLLDWAERDLNLFNEYLTKAKKLFDSGGVNGANADENLFRSALLDKGLYYREFGGEKYSFLYGGKHRDYSWKRLLRERDKAEVLRLLLNNYDVSSPLNDYFRGVIEASTVSDWRRFFIHAPEIFNYQQKKVVSQFDSGEITVLEKERKSAPHVELATYFWQLKYGEANNYLDSNHGMHSFSANFPCVNGDVAVKFIPGWDDQTGRIEGKYILSASFEFNGLELSPDSQRWERYFLSSQSADVEDLLKEILANT